jgi:hypothetical protein
VYNVGAEALHPMSLACGAVVVSVSLYPVTAILSVAVKLFIGTINEAETEETEKVEITGDVISPLPIAVVFINIFEVKGSRVNETET